MAQSIFGVNYDNNTSYAATALNNSTFTRMQGGDGTALSGNVGCSVGTSLALRNTSGSSQEVEGLIAVSVSAVTTTENVIFTLGKSSDDSSYSEVDTGLQRRLQTYRS